MDKWTALRPVHLSTDTTTMKTTERFYTLDWTRTHLCHPRSRGLIVRVDLPTKDPTRSLDDGSPHLVSQAVRGKAVRRADDHLLTVDGEQAAVPEPHIALRRRRALTQVSQDRLPDL